MYDRTVSTVGVMFECSADDSVERFPRARRVINDYSYPEYANWIAVAYDPRCLSYSDSDVEAMDETNIASILSNVEVGDEDFCYVARVDGHYLLAPPTSSPSTWSHDEQRDGAGCSWCGAFAMVDSDCICEECFESEDVEDVEQEGTDWRDVLDYFVQCRDSLADYPLLDEESYSEREHEAWCDYADDGLLFDMARDGDFDNLDDDTRESIEDGWSEVWTAAMDYTHYTNGWDPTSEVGPRGGMFECVAHAFVDRLIGCRTFVEWARPESTWGPATPTTTTIHYGWAADSPKRVIVGV